MAIISSNLDLEEEIAPKLDGKRIPRDIKQQILGAIANIEYGSVEVLIHDSKVVQIECRKKIRVDRNESGRRGVIP